MIVSPDSKIVSCAMTKSEVGKTYECIISGNELEVAVETEVTTDETICGVELHDNYLYNLQQLHQPEQRHNINCQQQQRDLQQCCGVGDDAFECRPELDDFQCLPDFYPEFSDSVSTLSIEDDDAKEQEDSMKAVNDMDLVNILGSEEANDFNYVFDFCEEVLSEAGISTTDNITNSFINTNKLSLFDPHPSNVESVTDVPLPSFVENRYYESDGGQEEEGSFRKSVRIAKKKQRSQFRRRSDGMSEENTSEELEDGVEVTRNVRRLRNSRSRLQDEEFVLRRRTRKKKRNKSIPGGPHESPDLLKELKQEKNRLAARKCRLKQRVLTENLTSEADNLEKERKNLKEEIRGLQSELLRLQCAMVYHDNLITSCPTTYRCPLGASNIDAMPSSLLNL